MVRVRKPQPSLENTVFATPEQRVLRFLLGEPTTTFVPRVIASRLKGVRGLGGVEGINKILGSLEQIGLVEFVDNRRAVRLRDENSSVTLLKTVAAVCDLQGVREVLEPISSRGILFGSRAEGKAASDQEYDLCVVGNERDEIENTTMQHPLGKLIRLCLLSPEEYEQQKAQDSELARQLGGGIMLWGPTW